MITVRAISRLSDDPNEYRTELFGKRPAGGWGYSKKYNLIHWRLVEVTPERIRFRPAASYFLTAIPLLVFLAIVWVLLAIVTAAAFRSAADPTVSLPVAILAMTSLIDLFIAIVVLPLISGVWARFEISVRTAGGLDLRKSGWWVSARRIPLDKLRALTFGAWPKSIQSIPVQDTARIGRNYATVWIWDVTLHVEDARIRGAMAPIGLWLASEKAAPDMDAARPPESVIAVGRWLQQVTGTKMKLDTFQFAKDAEPDSAHRPDPGRP